MSNMVLRDASASKNVIRYSDYFHGLSKFYEQNVYACDDSYCNEWWWCQCVDETDTNYPGAAITDTLTKVQKVTST